MVIWLTGLSGAGKTTISQILYQRLKPRMPELVVLDGDMIRNSLSTDLGFTEEDRVRQISRVQRLAGLLSTQQIVVIVAVVYANAELLEWNRRNLPQYLEVLVDAPLEIVQARDPKGLYGRMARGETSNVVGIDLPWHRPARPDLIIDTTLGPTAEDAARVIAMAVPQLARHWSDGHQ